MTTEVAVEVPAKEVAEPPADEAAGNADAPSPVAAPKPGGMAQTAMTALVVILSVLVAVLSFLVFSSVSSNAALLATLQATINSVEAKVDLAAGGEATTTSTLSSILTKASYSPEDRVTSYSSFFSLSPNDLSNMHQLSFIAPLDWECQTRAPYGPFPCVEGIPSKCRFYLFDDVTDVCAYAYCNDNPSTGPVSGDLSECCGYFQNSFAAPRDAQTEWASTTTPPLVANEWATAKAANPAVCDAEINFLHTNTWGIMNWWDDFTSEPCFNVMKITRYEYSTTAGLQFFGTTGDTLVIEPNGCFDGTGDGITCAYYKPQGHHPMLHLPLNESLVVNPVAVGSGRRLEVSIGEGGGVSSVNRAFDEHVAESRAGSGLPSMGFRRVQKVSRSAAPPGPMDKMLAQQADNQEHGRKLGFFSALMTSGSFMMMQAGAFR